MSSHEPCFLLPEKTQRKLFFSSFRLDSQGPISVQTLSWKPWAFSWLWDSSRASMEGSVDLGGLWETSRHDMQRKRSSVEEEENPAQGYEEPTWKGWAGDPIF